MELGAGGKIVKFLLVEDDDSHAKIVLKTFERERICNVVDRVRDGAEALDYLKGKGQFKGNSLPDVVLLDLKLPKINGFEVLKEIKSDKNLSHLPVIALTTSEADIDKSKAYDLHVNSYLVKPADAELFRQMVKDLNLYWTVWNQGDKSNKS